MFLAIDSRPQNWLTLLLDYIPLPPNDDHSLKGVIKLFSLIILSEMGSEEQRGLLIPMVDMLCFLVDESFCCFMSQGWYFFHVLLRGVASEGVESPLAGLKCCLS